MPKLAGARVLVFTDASSDGGAGRYIDYLFRVLEREGAAATLVFADPTADWGGFPAVKASALIDLGVESADLINVLQHDQPEFARHLERIAPDLVVFSNSCCVANLGPRAGCAGSGIPTVHVEHGCSPDLRETMADAHAEKLAACLAAARAVITVSDFGVAMLADVFGYPADTLRMIHNPVRDEIFAARDPAARARLRGELGIGDAAILVLSTGHVVGYKGVAIYLDFIITYADQLRALDCRFVWAGAHLAKMRELVEGHGVGDLVAFVGWRGDVPDLLDAADVFLHTSVNEVFGISVAEAMAKALPTLAFAVGGVPEVLGDAGVLAAVGPDRHANTKALFTGLLKLLRSPDRYGAAARARAEDLFRFDRFARATAAVLEDAVSALPEGRSPPSRHSG